MKNKFTLVIFLIVFGVSSQIGAQMIPELLYYKFDGTGTSVPNYASSPPSGTATATIMGGQTQGGANICQGTLIGTGQSSNTDFVNTGWATNFPVAGWTISFRTNNIPSTTSTYYILGDVNAGGIRVFTGGVAGPGNWILRGPLTDVLANGGASTGPSMTTFVYDANTNDIRAYVNGVLVSTVAQAGVFISGIGPFKVGGYSTSASLPLGSFMDEFRLYDHPLTAAEVALLYNPYATENILADTGFVCPGNTITYDLNPVWPISNVLWSNGSTADTTTVSTIGYTYVTLNGACATGYDSTFFVGLATSSSISPTSCDLYVSPGGDSLTSSGLYMDTITNANGCDSVISINLTIHNSTANSLNPSICLGSTYLSPAGNTYSSTGIYSDTIPNFTGCDSVITIDLIVNNPTLSSLSPVICSGEVYLSPAGNSYTSTGTYTDTIPNFIGCDSIITVNLVANTPSNSTISPSICSGDVYVSPAGNSYASAGTFMDTIPNFNGCDSVITINLGVTTVDVSITQTGTSGENLNANATSAAYQWINCPSLTGISGETNQAFSAIANGDYAVIITQNSCVDTSACYTVSGLGVDQNGLANIITVYPNPGEGQFMLDLGMTMDHITISINGSLGQVIFNRSYTNTEKVMLEIDGLAGIYFINVTNDKGERAVLRVIKK